MLSVKHVIGVTFFYLFVYSRGFVISELLKDKMAWDLASIRKNLEFTEKTKGEIKQLFHPYYIVNLVLSFSFLFLKLTHPFCDYLFAPGPVRTGTCELALT